MIRAELELLVLTDSAGLKRDLVTALINEIKQDAIEADHAYQQETVNLHNTIDSAIEGLVETLYNLRNA
jgi:hypothetical protein